jgi:N-acetylglucosamine malate deacetylase 1
MIEHFKNVLILAPHTDDGELGAGGTITKLIEGHANVYYVAFSTAEQSLSEDFPKDILRIEVKEATKKLGIPESNLMIFNYEVRKLSYVRQEILEELVRIRNQISIDLILMPCLNDIHQDHTTVALESLRAFKTKTILGYELIWNNLSFNTTSFVCLEERHIHSKIAALRAYKSQRHRDYMRKEFVFSLARTRGVQIGSQYAEAFEVIRLVM